jgi:hypothetical protein
MAEPSYTRAEIRRELGLRAEQEFFLRYDDGYILPTVIDSVSFQSTDKLKQIDDFWEGAWIYNASLDETRICKEFEAGSHRLYPEWEFSSGVSTTDEIELWDLWSPKQIHNAIGNAIQESWKAFPRVVMNERIVVQEDVTRYTLDSGVLNPFAADAHPNIGMILNLWLETSRNSVSGVATGGDSTVLNDTAMSPDTTADTDWLVSIFKGAGVGQLREVTSVSPVGAITPTDEFVTGPDTTSLYVLWDVGLGEQEDDWYKMTSVRLDRLEHPSMLYLTALYPAARGLRMRLQYISAGEVLSADSDVTFTPKEYIILHALGELYETLVSDNRSDRSVHAGLADYFAEKAQKYMDDNARESPAETLWMEEDVGVYGSMMDDGNPLGW